MNQFEAGNAKARYRLDSDVPKAEFAAMAIELQPGLPRVGQMNDHGMAPPAHIPYSGGNRFSNSTSNTPNQRDYTSPFNRNRSTPRRNGNSNDFRYSPRSPKANKPPKKLEVFHLVNPNPITQSSVPIRGIRNETGVVKYPLLLCSQEGTIMLSLAAGVLVEICVDRSFRLVCNDDVMVYVNSDGSVSSILHKYAKIVHSKEHVHCKFANVNDRLAVLGPEGILFSMRSLMEAYLVSNANSNSDGSPSVVALQKPEFPIQNIDYSLHQMYAESKIGVVNFEECNAIVRKSGYERRSDGTLAVHINGMFIKCNNQTGDVSVESKPVSLSINSHTLAVHLRSGHIDMAVQDRDKCYVKRGDKRIHTSRSGMVVSDGTCTISMDQSGRILSCS